MPIKKYTLPEYPCTSDVWDMLAAEKRPIAVYGMGNGADKLFRRFEKYGIKPAEIFASDGFVRGHSFRGFRVKSFSEIKAQYPDFVIVLSFGSNRRDVIDMLADIDSEYEMYVPDMPVCDEEEYFDREFYNANYADILKAYSVLADDTSKNIYAAVVNYRLSGKLSYLLNAYNEREELYSLLNEKRIEYAVDAGAYNGDTAREACAFFPELKKIYAIEADKRNFKKLSAFAEASETEIVPINAAVYGECGTGSFTDSGNRNSSVASTASYKHKNGEVEFITVDSLDIERVDYIKYDVEGAEYEALVGSSETVRRDAPALLVSVYHRSRDLFFLPLYLSKKYENRSFYIRRLLSVPAWEIDLIMLPKRECPKDHDKKQATGDSVKFNDSKR